MAVATTLLSTAAVTHSSLSSLLVNFFLVIATLINIYGLYRYFFNRSRPDPDMQAVRQERLEREACTSKYAINTIENVNQNVNNIIESFKQQKTHMQSVISSFENAVKDRQTKNNDLKQVNTQQVDLLQKDNELLNTMKSQYQEFCKHIETLFHILKTTCETIQKREGELSEIVNKLEQFETQTHATVAQMSQAAQGIASIHTINKKIKQLQEKNMKLHAEQQKQTETIRSLLQSATTLFKNNQTLEDKCKQLVAQIMHLQQNANERVSLVTTKEDAPLRQSKSCPSLSLFDHALSTYPSNHLFSTTNRTNIL
ncbi:MAG TPA: hypothetical protein VHD33_08500 [Legionellaceae bacterium]|nr:hypothetical protein [Legionellaceae bacterium]